MPGRIVGELLAFLLKEAGEAFRQHARNVCIGLRYTGVQLENGHLGLCATLTVEQVLSREGPLDQAGRLAGNLLFDLVKLAGSWRLDEAVVGIAAMNAASQLLFERRGEEAYRISYGNLLRELKVTSDDIVVMVGNLRPMVEPLREKASVLYVLERSPLHRGSEPYHLPDTACEEYLPRATLTIITASTLANGTLDRFIELAEKSREIAVVGPSSPLTPDILFNHGVTVVGGMHVRRPEEALRVIMEGGGTRELKAFCDRVNLRPKR